MEQNNEQEGGEIDLQQLNNAVEAFYGDGSSEQQRIESHDFLVDFFSRKDIYLFIKDIILSECDNRTKFMSINEFKNYVNSSWELIPEEIRQELRQFIWELLFTSNDFPNEIKTKIIEMIVAISKYEFPQYWPNFIQELVSASSESLENCCTTLQCLDILSQEISDFAGNSLTSVRAAEMVNAFTEELQSVIDLIQKSFSSEDQSIVTHALKTFSALVKWIDPQFFFQTEILSQLCDDFLDNKDFTALVISILGEIVSMNYIPEDYHEQLGPIFSTIISKVQAIREESEEDFNDSIITSLLSVTLTSFLSQYYEAVELPDYYQAIQTLHEWLIEITKKSEDEEFLSQENNSDWTDSLITYWYGLAQRIYFDFNNRESVTRDLYESFLPDLRRALISRIPSPYDFRETDEEDGFHARSVIFKTKYGDTFNNAKDALVILAKLSIKDTVDSLTEFLQEVQNNGFDRLDLIDSTCWSFGAVVGTLSEQSNKVFVTNFLDFFVTLFNDADGMGLDEDLYLRAKRTVAMATCFMSSQAHKFYIRDNELLVNIVNFLLSLLSYEDEDVKAVAIHCLEFLGKTSHFQIVAKQPGTEEGQEMSILEQILLKFQTYFESLSENSLLALFRLTAFLIKQVSKEEIKRQMFIITSEFLSTPLSEILPLGQELDPETLHGLTLLIQCNSALTASLGFYYSSYFLNQHETFLEAFSTLTEVIAANQVDVSIIRAAKVTCDAIIILFERTIFTSYDSPDNRDQLFGICMKSILPLFESTPDYARSPKVLKLFGTLSRYQEGFCENIKLILDGIYEPVLNMIRDDFDSFEDIRLDFYDFILSLVRNCIEVIISMDQDDIDTFVEAIKFGMRHPKNDVSEKSHLILTEFISKVSKALKDDQEQLGQFISSYAVPSLTFAFEMLTDTTHKSSFTHQVNLIKTILSLPSIGDLAGSIFESLCELFADQQPGDIEKLLQDMMNSINNPGLEFSNLLKDFLISVKHLLPQDPDLMAAQKEEALKKTEEFFRKIEKDEPSPLDGYPDP